MPQGHDIRAELAALQDDLATAEKPAADRPPPSADIPDPTTGETDQLECAMQELRTFFAAAARDAEKVVLEHPLAALAAAFALGVLAGRVLGSSR